MAFEICAIATAQALREKGLAIAKKFRHPPRVLGLLGVHAQVESTETRLQCPWLISCTYSNARGDLTSIARWFTSIAISGGWIYGGSSGYRASAVSLRVTGQEARLANALSRKWLSEFLCS